MKVYKNTKLLIDAIDKIKKQNLSIGFVPTMGYLHEGHLSLIRRAKKDADFVIVSIFVNPIQFGPKEDFKKYPRNIKKDTRLCRENGVDIIFTPSAKSIYQNSFSTYVNVENLTENLCGASRKGHFRGVTTVVTKLFNIIKPDMAYFGQKDAQQVVVIKKMVKDLNVPLKIKIMPIIREKDGLAMSSRNAYLNSQERLRALSIYKSLKLAKALYKNGERNAKKIIKKMRNLISKEKYIKVDYVSIVDLENLKNINKISKKILIAVAVKIGKIRLIDNAYQTEKIAKSKKSNDGIYVVPAFTGLGAPYWNSESRGLITGLTRNSDWKNLVRAVIESVAYQSYDLFEAMRKDGSKPKLIKVDGGMVANNWFAQFLSNILNTKVLRPVIQETTALGVAFFAGYQAGEFKSLDEIKYKWKNEAIFTPKINKKLRNNLLQGWQQAIRKTLA